MKCFADIEGMPVNVGNCGQVITPGMEPWWWPHDGTDAGFIGVILLCAAILCVCAVRAVDTWRDLAWFLAGTFTLFALGMYALKTGGL